MEPILTSILGVATGLIGNIITGITNYKTKKLELQQKKDDQKHEREMAAITSENMIREIKANIERDKVIGEIEESKGELQAFSNSIAASQSQSPLFKEKYFEILSKSKVGRFVLSVISAAFASVDTIKATVRPVLTYYLIGANTWVTYMAWKIMQTANLTITSQQALTLFGDTVMVIQYLTVSAITWWFADRRTAKFLNQHISFRK